MATLARALNIDRARGEGRFEVVVIGGGATGLGSAVDAAARGYRTLLLEAGDFAHGTSSRSTKLIHGGVRYLAQGNIALVREALHERGLLLKNAPHLVHPRRFLAPTYSWLGLGYYGIGLACYDLLAGRSAFQRSRRMGRARALEHVPGLRSQGLRGGIVYEDGQFDDARLAVTLARTFVELGGTALNHAPVVGLIKQAGRVAGVQARDEETGLALEVHARSVVNATGVEVDAVRRLDDVGARSILTPSQGAHVVLDRSFLGGETAVMIPRTDDGRVIFAIPWHDRLLVGTTDTPVPGATPDPRPYPEEVAYLLEHLGRYLERPPGPEHVLSTFAGLRPLLSGRPGSGTAKLSREHAVLVSESGLVTVAGGKWTTYRKMAADAIDQAARTGGLELKPSPTAELKLDGWCESNGQASPYVQANPYGSRAGAVDDLCSERPEWGVLLAAGLPYRAGEVVWAARHEAARTVDDVLSRRTRLLFLDVRASLAAAPTVARLLAVELGRDQGWQDRQVADFRALAASRLPSM